MKFLETSLPRFLDKYRRSLTVLTMILILASGFLLRFDNLNVWQSNQERFFFDKTPILLSVDGYFYLQLARDLLENTYTAVDENRGVPENLARPWPPPLMSYLTYLIARVTSFSLEWIALIMPAILGLALAFPIYFLGKFYGGSAAGLSAAFFVLLSRHYAIGSSIGGYDTEILNLTLIMASCFFFLKFAMEENSSRYYYFGSGILTFFITAWWWDQAPIVAVVATAIPLAVAMLFYYRPKNRPDRIFLGIFGVVLGLVVLTQGDHIFNGVLDMLNYVYKKKISVFPTMGSDVAEQLSSSLDMFVDYSIGSTFGFTASCLGFALMIWRHRFKCLFLTFPFVVSLMSFSARRFLIFLAPVTALGIGFLIYELWQLRKKHYAFALIPFILIPALAWPNIIKVQEDNFITPVRSPFHFQAFKFLSMATPVNAVTWTDWGHGYPLEYYSRRGVVADGSYHSGELLFVVSVPLATQSFRLSANWMQFYVKHGQQSFATIKKLFGGDESERMSLLMQILQNGPDGAREILGRYQSIKPAEIDTWLNYFFPDDARPVYLLLDIEKIRTAWYYYGTWDFKQGEGKYSMLVPFNGVANMFGRIKSNGLDIDLDKGVAYFQRQPFPLRAIGQYDGKEWKVKEYKNGYFIFDMNLTTHSGVLMDIPTSSSVAAQLYARHNYDKRYFAPLLLKTPLFQIWQVQGDSYPLSHPKI